MKNYININTMIVLADDSVALIYERKRINDDDTCIYDYRILYYDVHKEICSEKMVEFSLDNEIIVRVLEKEDAFRYVGYSMELDEYYVDSIIKEEAMRFYIGDMLGGTVPKIAHINM